MNGLPFATKPRHVGPCICLSISPIPEQKGPHPFPQRPTQRPILRRSDRMATIPPCAAQYSAYLNLSGLGSDNFLFPILPGQPPFHDVENSPMVKSKSTKSWKTAASTAGAKPRGGRSVHTNNLETPDLLHLDNDALSEDNAARQGGGIDTLVTGANDADGARLEDRNVVNDVGSLTATVTISLHLSMRLPLTCSFIWPRVISQMQQITPA